MTTCRCGVDIVWVRNAETDERLPIEARVTGYRGPDRYDVTDFGGDGEEWTVKPIDPGASASGYLDHRPRCPR